MTKYILTKEAKGKTFKYTVTDENGKVISSRLSNRDYVACTANGDYYFGRLDLIGKGDHGRRLGDALAMLANPEQTYKKTYMNFIPQYRAEWKEENPFDEWVIYRTERAKEHKATMEAIAYLK